MGEDVRKAERVAKLIPELQAQMAEALPGVVESAAGMMQAINLIDGVPVGVRAGLMAQCMARANTARRVRDIDGYRQALRECAAYIMTALLEIGEPIILPAGSDPWTYLQSRIRFSETPLGREYRSEYKRIETNGPEIVEGYPMPRPSREAPSSGDWTVPAPRGPFPMSPMAARSFLGGPPIPTIRQILDPNGCEYQAGQMVCKLDKHGSDTSHEMVDPFLYGREPTGDEIVQAIKDLGVKPDRHNVVSVEDGDEAPD